MPFAHCNNIILNFTKMLLLRTLEYYQLVFGNKIQGYRNSKRMAVNGMVERLCKEEDVGYMDLWDSFVGNKDMYVRDGLHLSGKGAAVFAEGLSGAVASGLGKVRYLN